MHLSVCYCASCYGQQTLSDHAETWKRTNCDALFLYPSVLNGRWITKNEEYASRDDSNVFLDSVGYVKSKINEGKYNPLDRSSTIE